MNEFVIYAYYIMNKCIVIDKEKMETKNKSIITKQPKKIQWSIGEDIYK